MKLFLDTANSEEIRKAFSIGVLDGVTTNPSLAAKESRDFNVIVSEILQIFKGTDGYVNLEVVSEECEGMVEEAQKLAKLSKNVVVKVPCTEDGLKACRILKDKKIRVNVTLCFSASQALLAAKAGAFFISPFIGRLDDQNDGGMRLVAEIKSIYTNYNFKTQILVASIRSPRQVVEAAMIGADICTMPYSVFDKLYRHALTDTGLRKFLNDWHDYQSKLQK